MTKISRGLGGHVRDFLKDWSIPRQVAGESLRDRAAESQTSRDLRPRLEEADRVGTSICPFCAVGCAQLIYAKDGKPIHVEGDPRSPVNQGTLCPKGAGTLGLLLSPQRVTDVLYRAPYADRVGEEAARMGDGPHRGPREADAGRDLRRAAAGRAPRQPHAGHRLARRRHDGQRGELPHQEAASAAGLGMLNIENQARI